MNEVSFIFLQRLIQALLGFVNLILIVRFLNPIEQGWYYSFISLSSMFTLFDLGLSTVLLQLAAHFFTSNRWDQNGTLTGQTPYRFLSLLKQSTFLYIKLSFAFCLIILPAGFIFFGMKSVDAFMLSNWREPWIALIIATTLNILLMPIFSVIEGSGSIKEIYSVRLFQSILGSLFCWIVLFNKGGLWAASMTPLFAFFVGIIWIVFKRNTLISQALRNSSQKINWFTEIWPLQWRVGLSWLAGYLLTQIYVPILFHYQDAKVAGQMGLSLTLANMLGLLAQSWIARRIPEMGMSVAKKDWIKFDRIFKHDFYTSIIMYICGSILLYLLILIIIEKTHFGNRILPIIPFAGLLLVVFVNHITGALAAQLRSYKKEPLVFISLISTLATIPLALYGASVYSADGVVGAILFIQLIFTLPMSIYYWSKFNREFRLNS